MPEGFLVSQVIPILLRWFHVLAGIIWIGHLYFFNFVNVNFEKSLEASMKKPVIPQLRPRALWWFRWGAMLTMLSGVAYVLWEQFVSSHRFVDGQEVPLAFYGWFHNAKDIWITYGALLGLIMWFNVWFIIWPNQRVILAGISTGNKPADFDARVATAGKFSRINTYLSVPMLFGMVSRSHFGTNVDQWLWISMAVMTVVGFATAYHFIWMVGPRVGKEFIPATPAAPPPPPPAPPK
jgi:uncharacterized membrane protein